uniref:Uncharacterized protein n=1 Tax=Streptomyces sp. NBC_00049 TaxID=2903617 RepID=A0AAU2JJT5_9ACTN
MPLDVSITNDADTGLVLNMEKHDQKIDKQRLGRVLKLVHDGVDRVPIERSLVVDPVLKQSLRHLRSVKSQRPPTADSVEFAEWREEVAGALDVLACVLVFEDDRVRARAEAAAARKQAAEVRCRCGVRTGER